MMNLIEILKNILDESNHKNIEKLINEFQKIVWLNSDFDDEDKFVNVFVDLADVLDYYESNSEFRKESSSYYGDERLRNEILNALNKIEILKAKET